MADVTGPISTLPGSRRQPPPGAVCDKEGHYNRQAVARIQGETDSFGSEMIDMCQECLTAHLHYASQPQPGICQHHKGEAAHVSAWRDPEEGSNGPVYQVCDPCRKRANEAWAKYIGED